MNENKTAKTPADGGSAFPAKTYVNPDVSHYSEGMTLRQYAAIHLKVPNSGTDWLDEMIEEAKLKEKNK